MRRKEKAEASEMEKRLYPRKKRRLRCGIVGFVGWSGLIRSTGSVFVALLLEMVKASTAQYI